MIRAFCMAVTIGMWIGWALLWVWLARGVKPAARQEPVVSRALHLVPLAAATLLLIFPVGRTLSDPVVPRTGFLCALGLALTYFGLRFCGRARLVLARNWSGVVQVKEQHELVCTGPYARVRHPIYTGLLLALAGTALTVDAWRAALAWVIVWISFERKLRTEEAFMRAAFGERYEAYAAAVPRLVPRFW